MSETRKPSISERCAADGNTPIHGAQPFGHPVLCMLLEGHDGPHHFSAEWTADSVTLRLDDVRSSVRGPAADSFGLTELNRDALAKTVRIGDAFGDLFKTLSEICPTGRELAIVRTKLEEACFFARKSLASDPANQP